MNGDIIDGLATYLFIIIIITLHEFGHAWMASRCGDDTARLLGRVTLNPKAHMDPIGTVLLPMLGIFLSLTGSGLARFIIGWGKPVPVNVHALRRPKVDELLVAMAGPAMNVVVAFVALGIARIGVMAEIGILLRLGYELAQISLWLCFFNLLPVPPLDGSYLLKHLTGMSHAAFMKLSQYGFFIIIILIQIPHIQYFMSQATRESMDLMRRILFFP